MELLFAGPGGAARLPQRGHAGVDSRRRCARFAATCTCALEQAYFAFVAAAQIAASGTLSCTGRDSVVKAVLEIDRQLADIDRSFDLLLQATPVNAESAWREFRRSRFEKPPMFYYRPLAIDPTLLKRQLYLIPVERIEDPTLSYLFRQKQEELDRQITLLSDVDTPRFLPESLQIYGGVSDWLLQHANELLDRVPTRSGEDSMRGQLNATEFAKRAQQELGYYQQQCADFAANGRRPRRHVRRPDGFRRPTAHRRQDARARGDASTPCCSTKSARTW